MALHPLEPLSADEFRRTAEILRRDGHVTDTFRFASIELLEPAKQEVLAWRVGDAVPRHSFAVVWNRADNKTYEATVDLTGDAVLSIKHVPDVTPNFTVDEFHEVDEALHKHPDVSAKLARTRHLRHEPRHRRRLDLRQGADAREVPRPPAGLVRFMGPRDPRWQPVCPPGRRG